jgi:hypothetical protein
VAHGERASGILKWLTANEQAEIPEDMEILEEEAPEPDTVKEERETTDT